jgi:acetyl esterase/lipase
MLRSVLLEIWRRRAALLLAWVLGAPVELLSQSSVSPQYQDVVYATVDGKQQQLDLYLPTGVGRPPLVVWIHGGAWRRGTKAEPPAFFVDHGFALASLEFRQSTEARFPAAVHDIKAGIRFLRANADRYGYSADRIAIAGASSGGHYAALVGVTNGHPDLEGAAGDDLDESSSVDAIISYYGASNLTTILAQSTPYGVGVRGPALALLLGDALDSAGKVAELASPVFQVDRGDPPVTRARRRVRATRTRCAL